MIKPRVVQANLADSAACRALLEIFDAYVLDPMEGGEPLSAETRRNLIPGLHGHPSCLAFLAYADRDPIGMAVSFLGYSTFAARPLINVHDLAVIPAWRRRGVGQMLMDAVEGKARELGCCKLTLEVHRDNDAARKLYRRIGFGRVEVGAQRVPMEFWQKRL